MTDRERLIDLFKKIEYAAFPGMATKANLAVQFTDYALNSIVDEVLKSGVILPPCKVGDTMYLIKDNFIEACEVEGVHYTRRKNYVRLRPYYQEYIGNWSVYFTPSIRSFGKTIFLTRQEAEKALKERKKKC